MRPEIRPRTIVILLLILGTWNLSSSTASSQVLSDDFDDGTIAPSLWSAFVIGSSPTHLLGEEGIKGFRSSGVERANASPCP